MKAGRGAGILLPVSSLPSDYGIGTLGKEAFSWVDFLKTAGQKYWQVLPVGPTGFGDSPYQPLSAFAGNPYLIDLDLLSDRGLLKQQEIDACRWGENPDAVDYAKLFQFRFQLLFTAFLRSRDEESEAYRLFCEENAFWLDDYSLFMALKFRFDQQPWLSWPEGIRFREEKAAADWSEELKEKIRFWKFCQFHFSQQWGRLKRYANRNGVRIVGDLPIYAALDSADVWAHPDLFQLDARRRPVRVAGVPPDLFSETGQLWGNPLYDWDAMRRDDFLWWRQRMSASAEKYDLIRIDHFIGIVRYYAIPADAPTAESGEWLPGPGPLLTDAIRSSVGRAEIIAEDLGAVVPEVRRLRERAGYPGMKVLEFAFDGNPGNEHLPHNFIPNCVAYDGTHDNQTLTGFFSEMEPDRLRFAKDYLGESKREELPWALIRALYASVADTVMVQAQDLLLLPDSARMNRPAAADGNWQWRLKKGMLTAELAEKLHRMAEVYGRSEA